MNIKAKTPFRFYTQATLPELTGLKAYNLEQLLSLIKTVPESCLFYHTHRFVKEHLYLSPEPPNDFAYWIGTILGDATLAEAVSSIDIVKLSSLEEIRGKLAGAVARHLEANPQARQRFSAEQESFHFVKAVSFVFPVNREAADLAEFAGHLKAVTVDSLYFHMFSARLRLKKDDNDFSRWLRDAVGDEAAARRISRLDPYTLTAEGLRNTLVNIIERSVAA